MNDDLIHCWMDKDQPVGNVQGYVVVVMGGDNSVIQIYKLDHGVMRITILENGPIIIGPYSTENTALRVADRVARGTKNCMTYVAPGYFYR